MKKFNFLCLSALLLGFLMVGCSNKSEQIVKDNHPLLKTQVTQEVKKAPVLQKYADKLVNDLTHSMPSSAMLDKIAIATMVDITTLEATDWLGREMAELFISSLHSRGFRVLEYKLTGYLEVTPNGDYAYSRNWQKLANKGKFTRVLTGTMSYSESGVMLYGRIVNLKTTEVEGSSQIFIPKDDLPICYKTYPNTCNIYGIDGFKSKVGTNPTPYVKVATPQNIQKGNVVTSNVSNKGTYSKPNVNKNNNLASKNPNANQKVNKGNNASSVKASPKGNINAKNTNQGNIKPLNNKVNSSKDTSYASSNIATKQILDSNPLTKSCEGKDCKYLQGKNKACHGKCSVPLFYPATTTNVGEKLVRDSSGQSQYDRN